LFQFVSSQLVQKNRAFHGESYFRTPRTTIISFIDLLAILDANPQVQWTSLIESHSVEADRGEDLETMTESDDELTSFRL